MCFERVPNLFRFFRKFFVFFGQSYFKVYFANIFMAELNQNETLLRLVDKCVEMCSLLEVARCELRKANKKVDELAPLGYAYQKFHERFTRILCTSNIAYYSFLKNDSRLQRQETAFYVVEEALLHILNEHSRKQYVQDKHSNV